MVVPADVRAVGAHDLSLGEVLLTRESLPFQKDPAPLPDCGQPPRRLYRPGKAAEALRRDADVVCLYPRDEWPSGLRQRS